jgi:hypothetical protein
MDSIKAIHTEIVYSCCSSSCRKHGNNNLDLYIDYIKALDRMLHMNYGLL